VMKTATLNFFRFFTFRSPARSITFSGSPLHLRSAHMKKALLASVALGLVLAAMALSGGVSSPSYDLQVDVQERNPWTNLRLNNDFETFHFAIVSDRTGGHRARVFSMAVDQLNLLQPSFVLSVGDLIEGYTKDRGKMAAEWKEFQTYLAKLQMPFFYV